jgi:hypothetical protein
MGNAIGTSPPVMINRIALREGASLNTQLAKVAELRLELSTVQAEAAHADPDAPSAAPPVNGAEVDRLV